MMRTKEEILAKCAELEEQLADGSCPDAKHEIDRLKWVLHEGPDHIHFPKPPALEIGNG